MAEFRGGFSSKVDAKKLARRARKHVHINGDDLSREVHLLSGRELGPRHFELVDDLQSPSGCDPAFGLLDDCACPDCRAPLPEIKSAADVRRGPKPFFFSRGGDYSSFGEKGPVVEWPVDLLSTRILRRRAGLACRGRLVVPNFALLCDCIVTDTGEVLGENRRPRTVFLHLGRDCRALAIFADWLLTADENPDADKTTEADKNSGVCGARRGLARDARFVLFTGGTDRLTPVNTWRKAGAAKPWQSVLQDPRVLAWFAENLVLPPTPRLESPPPRLPPTTPGLSGPTGGRETDKGPPEGSFEGRLKGRLEGRLEGSFEGSFEGSPAAKQILPLPLGMVSPDLPPLWVPPLPRVGGEDDAGEEGCCENKARRSSAAPVYGTRREPGVVHGTGSKAAAASAASAAEASGASEASEAAAPMVRHVVWTPAYWLETRAWKLPRRERVPRALACWRPTGTKGLNGDDGAERRRARDLFLRRGGGGGGGGSGGGAGLGDGGGLAVDWHEPPLPHRDFMAALGRYAFAVCVTGNGVDPCPKLFECLLMGCVPIAKRAADGGTGAGGGGVAEALVAAGLPVALVWDWTEVTPGRLGQWEQQGLGAAAFDARGELPARMTNEYWFDRCCAMAGLEMG